MPRAGRAAGANRGSTTTAAAIRTARGTTSRRCTRPSFPGSEIRTTAALLDVTPPTFASRPGACGRPWSAWWGGGARRRAGPRPAAPSRRSRASARLRAWERSSEATTRSIGPTFSSRRARCRGPSDGEFSMSKRTSTLVLEVLACWPPGPPLAVNRHSSSSRGIEQLRVTRRLLRPAAGSRDATRLLVSGTPRSPRSPAFGRSSGPGRSPSRLHREEALHA